MHSFIALASLLVSTFANASDLPQSSLILNSLNSVCSDTWCEGDFNLNFRKLNCNFEAQLTFSNRKGACKLDFVMTPHGSSPLSGKSESCLLTGYSSASALTRECGNSYDSTLSDRLYQDVSNCIAALEALK